jgi:hypothetical protein
MADTAKKTDRKADSDYINAGSMEAGEVADLKGASNRELDEAAKYLAGHDEYGPMSPEMEKKLVKKIDAWILPLVSPASCLQSTARTSFSLFTSLGSHHGNPRRCRQSPARHGGPVRIPRGQSPRRPAVQLAWKYPTAGSTLRPYSLTKASNRQETPANKE